MRTALSLVLLVALTAAAALLLREGGEAPVPPEPESLAALLGGADTAGFARATSPAELRFPRDHGPHPDFRNEWWYFVANVESPAGRALGTELVFFRTALAPRAPERRSAWATRQAWMAHFAVTDPAEDRFRAADRFSRGAPGLAGARAEPFGVWLEDWSATGVDPSGSPGPAAAASVPSIRLRAGAEGDTVDLFLQPEKPPVLHGEAGLSRKGAGGSASYYYSVTRFRASGRVRVGTDTFPVRGTAWLDHEWSTSALGPEQVGWDWFGLRLDDGRELMYYRLRRRGGEVDPAGSGTLVAADGTARHLVREEVNVEPVRWWTSPDTGVRYPVAWRLRVPGEGIELAVEPYLDGQELDLAVRYWEGAVRVEGRTPDGPVGGVGYVELTGYGPRTSGSIP